jgi:hypothetical protein
MEGTTDVGASDGCTGLPPSGRVTFIIIFPPVGCGPVGGLLGEIGTGPEGGREGLEVPAAVGCGTAAPARGGKLIRMVSFLSLAGFNPPWVTFLILFCVDFIWGLIAPATLTVLVGMSVPAGSLGF